MLGLDGHGFFNHGGGHVDQITSGHGFLSQTVASRHIYPQFDATDIQELVDHLGADGRVVCQQGPGCGLLCCVLTEGVGGDIGINEDRHGRTVLRG